MSKIELLTINEYAKNRGVHRTSVWRWLKSGKIDYCVLPHSKRKWIKEDKIQDSLSEYKDTSIEDQEALGRFLQDNEDHLQWLGSSGLDSLDYES